MWQRTILTCSIAIAHACSSPGVGLASAQSPRIESGLAFLTQPTRRPPTHRADRRRPTQPGTAADHADHADGAAARRRR